MLESTCDRLDYTNYDVFIGTYPNDEPTQFEVARAAFDRPRIQSRGLPQPRPDQQGRLPELGRRSGTASRSARSGKRYEILVLQDAEDVVHPLALKVFNRFVPEYDLSAAPGHPVRASHCITSRAIRTWTSSPSIT